jgi:hypothetical protein
MCRDPFVRAQGLRYVGRMATAALQHEVEHADPRRERNWRPLDPRAERLWVRSYGTDLGGHRPVGFSVVRTGPDLPSPPALDAGGHGAAG